MECLSWRQVNVTFPDYTNAEERAVAHLAPLLTGAEEQGLIASWFFIRKTPCWRIRYLPADEANQAEAHLQRRFEDLKSQRHITDALRIVYEPESHAFGGSHAMAIAHRLFHLDSRHLLAYLADTEHKEGPGHRRELSILLVQALLRAAGLDWYEQGDVWARVAEHRETPDQVSADQASHRTIGPAAAHERGYDRPHGGGSIPGLRRRMGTGVRRDRP